MGNKRKMVAGTWANALAADVVRMLATVVPNVKMSSFCGESPFWWHISQMRWLFPRIFLAASVIILQAYRDSFTWDVPNYWNGDSLDLGGANNCYHQRRPPATPYHPVRRRLCCYRCPTADHHTNSAAAAATAWAVAAAAAAWHGGLQWGSSSSGGGGSTTIC